MCGIAGYFVKKPSKGGVTTIETLLKSIRQRGPDDEGVCLIAGRDKVRKFYRTERTLLTLDMDHIGQPESIIDHDVALIHTRYAIIDLTAGGHQPFVSSDGSVVLVFNGEIYNYIELRGELSSLGVSFRTCSDTEVLIEGYRIWGHEIWAKLNGFWAVALYDLTTRCVTLSRDRLGVAPLYYRETAAGVYFASSIQALIDIDVNSTEIDRDKVIGFIQTSLKDFDNTTFYRQVKSVPPATSLTFDRATYNVADSTKLQYWKFPQSRLSARDLSFREAVETYRDTFFNAVEVRLRADVNLAFELSGGLDSSSAVAAGAILRDQKITTFTIQVPEENEEPFARSILERYGDIDYRVLSDSEDDFVVHQGHFAEIMEEPFHSPNIYTHYRMRQKMKADGFSVVLAGAGGDEVLAGYEGQFWPKASAELRESGHVWHSIKYDLAREFRTGGRKQLLNTVRKRINGRIAGYVNNLGCSPDRNPGSKDQEKVRGTSLGGHCTPTLAELYHREYTNLTFHQQSLFHWRVGLIPYYLRSNDHFTMAIPLEHRFPFLDYRMVELGLQMPAAYLFKNGWTKYILRKAMEPYLPANIVWRKTKMGFPFPYKRFLRTHADVFEPLVNKLHALGLPVKDYASYQNLLDSNPLKLWRLCSTALWLEKEITKRFD
jgi:asparagine synthase (glutamine-hydrolysing)